MSSWLDNLAAHVEEDEEEESPEIIPANTNSEQKEPNPPQIPTENIESKEENQKPVDSENKTNEPIPEKQEPKEEKSETPTIENTPTSNNSIPNQQNLPEQKDKQNSYSGPISKEMQKVDKALHTLDKRQEFLYASAMIKTRTSLDFSLEKTSKPIQTIGGLGKVSNEAKQKYDLLQRKIMAISPLCSVTPKSE